jgi:hypothetical protein
LEEISQHEIAQK